MLTLALILIPLAGSILVFSLPVMAARLAAFLTSILQLILTVFITCNFEKNSDVQLVFNSTWIPSLGLNFHVGMDGISLLLVLLTSVLIPFIILSSFGETSNKPSVFFALILLMQSALVGVFTSQDGLLFYLFWELALIPIYFICLVWGGENKSRITFTFFVYTLAGSLLMLMALIYLFYQTPGAHSFNIDALYEAGRNLPLDEQGWVFAGLFIAFAIKMPVFPFHTWQPDTYTIAPVQGTMLLSAIMLKMGLYGIIRWLLPVVPAAVQEWGIIAVILSVTGIIYASLLAIIQKDYKRLIAYSSIAHVGLISAGIFTLGRTGVQGAIIQMLSHGVVAFGLFYCIDLIDSRTKTRMLNELGGIRNTAPVFTTVLVILMLGSVSLPLTSGFVGEFLLLQSLFQYQWLLGTLGGLTIILGAVYMLKSFQAAMSGEVNEKTSVFNDLDLRERIILYPMALLVLLIGIFPSPLMALSEAPVEKLLNVFETYGVAFK